MILKSIWMQKDQSHWKKYIEFEECLDIEGPAQLEEIGWNCKVKKTWFR